MAITSITTLAGLRDRVRLMAGIEQEELDNDTLDILISVASEWFEEQIGTAYDVATAAAAYDNAVMYYTCYLASIAQNGMGIERIQVGDLAVYYEGDQFIHFKELAEQQLITLTHTLDKLIGIKTLLGWTLLKICIQGHEVQEEINAGSYWFTRRSSRCLEYEPCV